jgi:hypothetical protein
VKKALPPVVRLPNWKQFKLRIQAVAILPLPGSVDGSELIGMNGGKTMSIWTILFVVLLIAWLGGFTVFHAAGGLIHLLLVFAIISLILHFVIGRKTV